MSELTIKAHSKSQGVLLCEQSKKPDSSELSSIPDVDFVWNNVLHLKHALNPQQFHSDNPEKKTYELAYASYYCRQPSPPEKAKFEEEYQKTSKDVQRLLEKLEQGIKANALRPKKKNFYQLTADGKSFRVWARQVPVTEKAFVTPDPFLVIDGYVTLKDPNTNDEFVFGPPHTEGIKEFLANLYTRIEEKK